MKTKIQTSRTIPPSFHRRGSQLKTQRELLSQQRPNLPQHRRHAQGRRRGKHPFHLEKVLTKLSVRHHHSRPSKQELQIHDRKLRRVGLLNCQNNHQAKQFPGIQELL